MMSNILFQAFANPEDAERHGGAQFCRTDQYVERCRRYESKHFYQLNMEYKSTAEMYQNCVAPFAIDEFDQSVLSNSVQQPYI